MKRSPHGVVLTYRAPKPGDGTGAQAQRIAGIYGTARELGLGYLHSPVAHIGPNPGDSFDSPDDRKAFLRQLNELLQFPSDKCYQRQWRISRSRLRVVEWKLLPLVGRLLQVLSTSMVIAVESPYSWVDRHPQSYRHSTRFLRERLGGPGESSGQLIVDVHIRRGLVPQRQSNGRDYERFLATSWYIDVLREIAAASSVEGLTVHIRVHTDALEQGKSWAPPVDTAPETLELWKSLGVLSNGQSSTLPHEDFVAMFSEFGTVQVLQGLDPISAWRHMVRSDILVAGKSSFSYVASLIRGNRRVIACPFWHTPLDGWVLVPQSGISELPETRQQVRNLVSQIAPRCNRQS